MDSPTQPSSPRPGPRALFLAFLGIGLSGLGGVLPFARRALVERRRWLGEGEFNETLSLCQSLPGPSIVNLSVVVGSRFAGPSGAAAGLAGLVIAPVALVLVLASLWSRFGSVGHAPAAIRGLSAAAAGLAAATAVKMARPGVAGAPLTGGAIIVAAFLGVGALRLPLPWVLLVLTPVSVLTVWRRGR